MTKGLLLVIEKFPWANAQAVTKGVEAALEVLRGGLPGRRDRCPDLPVGQLSSKQQWRTRSGRSCSEPGCWCCFVAASMLEWRACAHRAGYYPAVVDRRRDGARLRGRTDQPDGSGGLVAALGAADRRRRDRGRQHPAPPRRSNVRQDSEESTAASFSRPRSRCVAADALRHPDPLAAS